MGNNKVILVGGNHHNGLGLVRCFGIYGIESYGIIVGLDSHKGFLKKSKYWKKVWTIDSEKEILYILKNNFNSETEKPVVIPYSDGAAQIIDENYNLLKSKFIVPSLNKQEGKITYLMNKQNQVSFAENCGFNMLRSEILDIEGDTIENTVKEFPVIIKPVASIEGNKLDISICYDANQFNDSLVLLKNNGYKRILVQSYLENKMEFVLTGAVTDQGITYTIVKHIRQWPINRGSGSFSEFDTSPDVDIYARKIMSKLQQLGFSGLCDIEFFKDQTGCFFLNEINWRCSGRNFVSLYTKVYSPYIYYCWMIGKKYDGSVVNKLSGFSMNEWTDFRHVLIKNISIGQWIKDFLRTNSYALLFHKDIKPVLYRFFKISKNRR